MLDQNEGAANCDFSPIRHQLAEGIHEITEELQESLEILGDADDCLLGKLEDIKEKFNKIETKAASFYLNCYLSAFTDKYSDLAVAIQRLSHHKHGALIVVERLEPVELLIQKGMVVGAALTPALLEAIFYPGNPLHDGAVLIRGNEIVSAANVLPLTSSIIIGKKVATRHRAALGLTERSDALVLVVSEETGRVSFALNGKLHPILTAPIVH